MVTARGAAPMCGWVAIAVLWAGLLAGYAENGESPVVAEVGDRAITARDVEDYIRRLPGTGPGEVPAERHREHLQTMVDMELLVMEAERQQVDRNSEFHGKLARTTRARLVKAYEERAIRASLSPAELAAEIRRHGYNRAIRMADIMVPDLETAATVQRALGEGAEFADLARKWSTNTETAPRGGDIDRYATRYEVVPGLAELVFALPLGAVSAPIRVGRSYSLLKVLDERLFELSESQKDRAAQELEQRKFEAARDSLVAALTQRLKLRRDDAGLEAFLAALKGKPLPSSPDPNELVIYRYSGGAITAADALEAASVRKENPLVGVDDVGAITSFVEQQVLADALLLAAALGEGLDREEGFARWLQIQRRQLMVSTLRAMVLQEKVTVSEGEVRQFYDAHPQRFLNPEQIEVQEVLVETYPLAERLRGQIEKGEATFGDVAREHSIRTEEVRDEEGRFHVHRYESPEYGGFVEAAAEAPIGELIGPVKVRDGYSVFRVLTRERKPEPFEEASWRVRSQLRREKSEAAFDEYLAGLRTTYASVIKIHEAAIGDAWPSAG